MDKVLFPAQYKKGILNKSKHTTIRVKNELDKYKAGRTYVAQSYAGNSWGQKIKVTAITKTIFSKLNKFGIPQKTITAIKRGNKIKANEPVEIIHFKYQ